MNTTDRVLLGLTLVSLKSRLNATIVPGFRYSIYIILRLVIFPAPARGYVRRIRCEIYGHGYSEILLEGRLVRVQPLTLKSFTVARLDISRNICLRVHRVSPS